MKMNFRKGRGPDPAEPSSEPISLFDDDGGAGNVYAQSVDVGHKVDPRAQKVFVLCVVLLVLYAVALVMPEDVFHLGNLVTDGSLGTVEPFSYFVRDVSENVTALMAVFTGNGDQVPEGALTAPVNWVPAKLIRYVVIALAGAGLALSGAVYQGAFRNALVSPSTLGVMTGGSFGLMVWVLASGTGAFAVLGATGAGAAVGGALTSMMGAAVISFAGCILVVGLVLATVRLAGGGTSSIVMILAGQTVAAVLGVVSNAVRYYYVTVDPYGEIAENLTQLQVSSFWRDFTVFDIVAIGLSLAATFAVVMRLRDKMMLLAFDEAEQRTMGVESRRVQTAVVSLCTLLTAIVISFCGQVGFVGFLVPHLARRLVGPNFKYLLPASTALGAVFVLGAYVLLLMLLGGDYQNMVGMFISIGGAAVFLVTAIRGKGVRLGEFR